MTQKQSAAKRRFWQQFTQQEKSQILSLRSKKAWAKRSKEQRTAQAKAGAHTRKLNRAFKS